MANSCAIPHKFGLPTSVQEFYPSVPGDLILVSWIFNSLSTNFPLRGFMFEHKSEQLAESWKPGSGSQVETITELTYFKSEAFLRVRRNV